jgi:hypothetical protein
MLSIITPCCRPHNLSKLYESIDFGKIDMWIIVYDTSKNRNYEKIYKGHPKIMELECNNGISGNPQRNLGMSLVDDGFIYFLDDDNIIHPEFWSILDSLNEEFFYTFDQLRDNKSEILPGNKVQLYSIDTAMFIVHKKHMKGIYWKNDRYDADGIFITDILNANRSSHLYINKIASYYNYLV